MKARPILFSGAMVRALLAGTKTQTRRIVKPQPLLETDQWARDGGGSGRWMGIGPSPATGGTRQTWGWAPCPYGVPGDLLWVKERLARAPHLWTYVADGAEVEWPARRDLASKRLDYAPSIHMPKIASRLTLEITDVRVERLQDISEEDAAAEGWPGPDGTLARAWPVGWYAKLWDEINGDGAYDTNPWVWAVSFKVHKQNVDTFLTRSAA